MMSGNPFYIEYMITCSVCTCHHYGNPGMFWLYTVLLMKRTLQKPQFRTAAGCYWDNIRNHTSHANEKFPCFV